MTAAYTLARAGVDVTVLERETRVGGLCGTHERRGFRFDLGGHRFISRSRALDTLVRELLQDSLLTRTRSSAVLHGAERYRYPLELDDVLAKVPLRRGARLIGSYLKSQFDRLAHPRPDVSFEDWVTRRFGAELYGDFFGPYTEKLWGIPPTQISADWASQRISLLSLSDVMLRLCGLRRGGARTYARRYLYPKLGIGEIFERMGSRFIGDGGRLELGARVTGVEQRDGRRHRGALRAARPRARRRLRRRRSRRWRCRSWRAWSAATRCRARFRALPVGCSFAPFGCSISCSICPRSRRTRGCTSRSRAI